MYKGCSVWAGALQQSLSRLKDGYSSFYGNNLFLAVSFIVISLPYNRTLYSGKANHWIVGVPSVPLSTKLKKTKLCLKPDLILKTVNVLYLPKPSGILHWWHWFIPVTYMWILSFILCACWSKPWPIGNLTLKNSYFYLFGFYQVIGLQQPEGRLKILEISTTFRLIAWFIKVKKKKKTESLSCN